MPTQSEIKEKLEPILSILGRNHFDQESREAIGYITMLLTEYAFTSDPLTEGAKGLQFSMLQLFRHWCREAPPVKVFITVENDMSVSVRTELALIFRGTESQAEIAYNAFVAGLDRVGFSVENANQFEFNQ